MASFEHIVSHNLQCPVCLDLLSDPKQLSCTHTFCQKCLGDMLACSKTRANSLVCPICRSKTIVKDCKIENLNTNVPLKSLVNDVRNSKQLCDMCDTQSGALHFCCDCGKNVCNACLDLHNNWPPHLKHEVVRAEDIREGKVVLKKKVYCQEHMSNRQEHVCTDVCITCKTLICLRCRILHHEKKGHTIQDVEEYSSSIKTEIESLLDQGKTEAATIKNRVAFVDRQKQRITDHIEGRKAEINKIYQALDKGLSNRKADLENQLDAQREKLCQRLDEMKVAEERFVESVECTSVLASNSLKAPLQGDIVAIRHSLSGELKNVLDREDPEKKLPTDVAERAEQLTFTPNTQHDQLGIGKLRFVKWKMKCGIEHSGRMNALTATSDGMVAMGHGGGGIAFFSTDGQLQKTVLKNIGVGEFGFLSDGRYVVLNDHGATLYTERSEKIDVTFDTLDKSEGRTGGLTVDSNDLIYVGYRKAKKIQVFLPAGGKAIREIPCDGYEPEQITSYEDILIVKDARNLRIVDKDGLLKHMVSKPMVSPWPTLTKDHTVLIAWVSHKKELVSIDEYTIDLKHVKTFISDHKFEKSERDWYYLTEFRTGEIALGTPDRLYIFQLSITPVEM